MNLLQINPQTSTLIMIDIQGRLMPAIQQSELILNQCIRIARIAQLLQIPVIGTEQSPASLGSNLESIKRHCGLTIRKEHFNACADGLIECIPTDRRQLILGGCETHVCLMQTALKLLEEQFDVSVLIDCVGSRRQTDKQTALDRLNTAGARLITSEMLAFEWLVSAKNPHFKEVLALIKE